MLNIVQSHRVDQIVQNVPLMRSSSTHLSISELMSRTLNIPDTEFVDRLPRDSKIIRYLDNRVLNFCYVCDNKLILIEFDINLAKHNNTLKKAERCDRMLWSPFTKNIIWMDEILLPNPNNCDDPTPPFSQLEYYNQAKIYEAEFDFNHGSTHLYYRLSDNCRIVFTHNNQSFHIFFIQTFVDSGRIYIGTWSESDDLLIYDVTHLKAAEITFSVIYLKPCAIWVKQNKRLDCSRCSFHIFNLNRIICWDRMKKKIYLFRVEDDAKMVLLSTRKAIPVIDPTESCYYTIQTITDGWDDFPATQTDVWTLTRWTIDNFPTHYITIHWDDSIDLPNFNDLKIQQTVNSFHFRSPCLPQLMTIYDSVDCAEIPYTINLVSTTEMDCCNFLTHSPEGRNYLACCVMNNLLLIPFDLVMLILQFTM